LDDRADGTADERGHGGRGTGRCADQDGDGTPFVFFQSFSGGAHCCNSIKVVVPENGKLEVYDLGSWDGGYSDQVPADVDGDGAVDFVMVDNSFLYTFGSLRIAWRRLR